MQHGRLTGGHLSVKVRGHFEVILKSFSFGYAIRDIWRISNIFADFNLQINPARIRVICHFETISADYLANNPQIGGLFGK